MLCNEGTVLMEMLSLVEESQEKVIHKGSLDCLFIF